MTIDDEIQANFIKDIEEGNWLGDIVIVDDAGNPLPPDQVPKDIFQQKEPSK